MLLFLVLFFFILLGVLFFQSSFSKIHQIEVTGHQLLSEEQIVEAAGVRPGDHFFAVSSARISGRVGQLGPVDRVRTVKRFPGRIHIAVQEFPVVAVELSKDGGIAGLLSNGTSVPYDNIDQAASRPVLAGWEAESVRSLKAELARTLAGIAPELLQDVSEIRPSPTDSYADRIIMYTRSQYEVVTTVSYLPDKISLLATYIYEMKSDGRTSGRIVLLDSNYGQSFESGTEESPAEKAADSGLSDDSGE